MGITVSSGIGSGIEIRKLVDDLLAAEGEVKTQKFDTDEGEALAKITAYGTLKGALAEFQSSLTGLKDIERFQSRTASSQDEDILTVTASSSAVPSSYSIEVTQLAEAEKYNSKDFTDSTTIIGTGDLQFTVGTKEYTITIGSSENTVSSLSDAINQVSGTTGVMASVVNGDAGARLVLTSANEGTESAFSVAVVNDGDGNDTDNSGLSSLITTHLTQVTAAQDSIIKIDGATLTTSSNTITEGIEGLTLDLKATNVGDPKTVTIGIDKVATQALIEQFIEGYNTVFDTINELNKLDQSGLDDAANGVLLGDATLRNLEMQIRKELNEAFTEVPGGFATLSQIGITSNELTGKLQLKQSELTEALNQNFDAVGQLFAHSSEGVAVRLDSLVTEFNKSDGIINTRTDGLNETINDIAQKRVDFERYLGKFEERLMGQFIAMDALVATLQNTSDFLTDALKNLPEPNSTGK